MYQPIKRILLNFLVTSRHDLYADGNFPAIECLELLYKHARGAEFHIHFTFDTTSKY